MNFTDFLFQNTDRTALFLAGKDKCSYGQLVDDVSHLANGLAIRYGKGKEIVLLSDNGLFFIVCYLSIVMSGNVAMLMDPRIRDEEIAAIFGDKIPDASFVQKKYQAEHPLLSSWSEDDLPGLMSKEEYGRVVDNDALAAVVFTSGSTGAKKGVMITHGNLIANTSSIIEYLELTNDDRILVTLPFHYCYGASLLHTHIRSGGSIVLFDANFLGAVPNYIDKYSCTGFAGVPSTYQILLARSKFLKEPMPTLRYMTQAGGKLENVYIKQIVDAFPEKRFFVMYGATEATARMSYLPPEMLGTKLGSIGMGIPGVDLKVFKEDGNEVRPGEVGEIRAKGDNIMVGYYKDPEGTAAILKNGRYCTGDLATVDEDGFIYIVGRDRDIIKSAGYRISPYEVESIVCEIKGVVACAVVGVPDSIMGEAITAIVQPDGRTSERDMHEQIISECKKRLPSYKIPKRILFKGQLPTNSSNKVDKVALRKELAEMR